jgi:predicted regulator of Ras-like GTPase activity (Roadblock/LC7/MglB family)
MSRSGDSIAYLREEDLAEFDLLLLRFLHETNAKCALLVDRAGRLLTSKGDTGGLDQTTFASLAAADFGASDQLAALLGEDEFTSLYHHGARGSMYLVAAGRSAVVAALFDERTTLGLVRLKLRPLIPQFEELLAGVAGRQPEDEPVLEADWWSEAEGEIDRFFSEG